MSRNTGHLSSTIKKYFPASCDLHTVDLCATSTTLTADAGQPNYTWSTGATTQSITVNSSGTYWWETIDYSNNKVSNGDFTNGNSGITSGYTYIAPTGSTGSFGALSSESYYTVSTNPRNTHTLFASFSDHTGNTPANSRKMMIVNGASVANVVVWQQTVTVQPNTDYIFSIWFTSVYPDNPGKLNFSINGSSLGSPILLTSGTPDWENFTVRWNSSNNTSAVIGVVNQNTVTSGNDFAIDDIVFAPVCRNTYVVNLHSNPSKPSITLPN